MSESPRIAILTSHGQPSAPEPAEQALADLAAQVAALLPDWQIRSATLAMPDRLEQVMTEGAQLYPFFMTDGLFTSKILPGRLTGFRYHMLAPFGQDTGLPAQAATILRQEIAERGLDQPVVLLAAHGSARGPKAAQATEAFAQALRVELPEFEVRTSYLEEAPRVAEVAARLTSNTICLPYFAQSGDHVTDDIPEALQEAKYRGHLLPALGSYPFVAATIAQAIRRSPEVN